MDIKQLTLYFESLAERHPWLCHHDSSDTDDPERLHFFRGELEEFFQQFRSGARFPALVMESYDTTYTSDDPHPTKRANLAFIVVQAYDTPQQWDEITAAQQTCEQIADSIILRLQEDADRTQGSTDLKELIPFCRVEVQGAEGAFIQNTVNRYVGYRVQLTITAPIDAPAEFYNFITNN